MLDCVLKAEPFGTAIAEFYGWMPFLLPNKQCHSTVEKYCTVLLMSGPHTGTDMF